MAGIGASEMRRILPTRRSKPRLASRRAVPHAETPLTVGRPAGGQKHRWLSSQGLNGGESRGLETGRRDERFDHRGWRGANLTNTARGTPWVWRTCGVPRRTPDLIGGKAGTTKDFDKPRCREASRPVGPSTLVCAHLRKLACARDPWRPARPRFFSGRAASLNRRRTRRRKETGRWRLP